MEWLRNEMFKHKKYIVFNHIRNILLQTHKKTPNHMNFQLINCFAIWLFMSTVHLFNEIPIEIIKKL